jgi:hypothetical protein
LAQPWEIMAALTHQSSPSFPRSPHNGPHGSKPWWTLMKTQQPRRAESLRRTAT